MISVKCQMIHNIWKIWKYSLGSFNDSTTKKYDNSIVILRSVIFISYLVTNVFIISGVIRHWDSSKTVPTVTPSVEEVL